MSRIFKILIAITFINNITAQSTGMLQALVDSSDLIISGNIASRKCISSADEECFYQVDIDSVYKGTPKFAHPEFLPGYTPKDRDRKRLQIISFKRRNSPLEVEFPWPKKHVILFLKKSKYVNHRDEGYTLIDTWLGMQTYNQALAYDIRLLCKKE